MVIGDLIQLKSRYRKQDLDKDNKINYYILPIIVDVIIVELVVDSNCLFEWGFLFVYFVYFSLRGGRYRSIFKPYPPPSLAQKSQVLVPRYRTNYYGYLNLLD